METKSGEPPGSHEVRRATGITNFINFYVLGITRHIALLGKSTSTGTALGPLASFASGVVVPGTGIVAVGSLAGSRPEAFRSE